MPRSHDVGRFSASAGFAIDSCATFLPYDPRKPGTVMCGVGRVGQPVRVAATGDIRERPLTMNRSVRRWVGAATVLLLGLLAWFVSLPTPRASALFSQGVSVSPAGYDSSGQRVAFDRQGHALLVWVRENQVYPYTWRVQIRSRNTSGAWGSTITVSPAGQAPRNPKVALDDDGDAAVVWDAYDGTDRRVYARRVSRTGTLGTLKVLSMTGVNIHGTDVAVDS